MDIWSVLFKRLWGVWEMGVDCLRDCTSEAKHGNACASAFWR